MLTVNNLGTADAKGTYSIPGPGTNSWEATVSSGASVTKLGSITLTQGGATVTLGSDNDVILQSLTANDEGTIVTPGDLTIKSNPKQGDNYTINKVHNLEVEGVLTLGTAETAATLSARGSLIATGGIVFANIGSSASADKLETTTLNVDLTDNFMAGLEGGSATLLTLNEEFTGTIKLSDTLTMNGTDDTLDIRSEDNKYIYTLSWETQLTRATANQWYLVLNSNINSSYVREALTGIASSHNGIAGMNLLNDVYAELNPQTNMPESDLAELIDTVDAGAMTDDALAAAAGASVAVLGQALSGDVERQLRAIRNRAVSSSITSCDTITVTALDEKGNEVRTTTTKPDKFSVWVNAEGNRTEQDADGTAAGYTLTSWGGTLGAGMQVNQQLTLGLALTAMSGNLKSDGPDRLKGDMETTYLSAFAQYLSGAWNHSFIGTVGTMDTDYDRTVNHAASSYTADGDTDGTAFGLMYELSRKFALSSASSISPVFNISYRHTDVDGYAERNSDAAVSVDDQSLDTVTVGLGARYEATVGQQTLNRACAFEARALAKYDFGDRQTDTEVGFIGQATRANIESAELGAFGVELGAGISVPVGPGSIFADGSVELRSEYTNANATVGYKIQF
ncbi:MAG: autotransporter outer membrane beta-barrel domain-containing protein [Akkermansia sp.]|nr:autotransporter outer membrane beta-barrel domain-containing protein [Akkermansia sp.]